MKNPIVYILSDESEEIIKKRILCDDVAFIMDSSSPPAHTISKIQQNSAKLNLSRINLYALNIQPTAAAILRKAFTKNFPTINMTLLITNENILRTLSDNENPYDQIFIFTQKNELGEILPTAQENISEIIAALPLINTTSSTFNEAISARMKERITLASAGFWQPPPSPTEENRRLHKLADDMEKELLKHCAPYPHHHQNPFEGTPNLEICDCISGVASRPLRFWNLIGKNIHEAEKLLFGDEAKKNFCKYFLEEENPQMDDINNENHLLRAIEAITQQINHLTDALQEAEGEIIKIQPINYIKIKIGETYATRHRLQQAKNIHARLQLQQNSLQNHMTLLREKIKTYKSLPIEAPPIPLGEAPIAISLLRDDALLREEHIVKNANGELCRLRLVGGFGVDDMGI
ncbi:MAG: hypothetical protein FWF78_02910 [Defluviitaleaceae bacterium]|nr:hypothetical protein [Defluviitaleaceae bacterium]